MKKLLSITAGVLSAFTVSAQCPQITCLSNITVNNAPGTCGAVVNYVTPVGTNPCGSSSQTFNYTGNVQTFTVPNGVTSITIEVWGAEGGTNTNDSINCIIGGKGGYAKGDLTVTPGQILEIYVGGRGYSGNVGGWNGAGIACPQTTTCSKGGGATDVRQGGSTLNHRVIVAGGGGGAEWSGCSGTGGNGGGLIGNDGAHPITGPRDGKGGTQVAGGAAGLGGYNGTSGVFGVGGNAGTHPAGHAGSGGGGWYGGGGSAEDGHAGGGSSYIGGVTNASTTQGLKSGHGQAIISWTGGPAITTQTAGLPDGATFPVGVTTNWYKVEDGLGNADSCSFTVTVVDNEAPSITCPGDTTICWGVYNANITSSDNCPGATVTQTNGPTLGSSFDVGTYNLVFVVTDASGNKDTCDYNVTVEVCGGVNENNQKYGISVYPNPMREYVIIENKHIEGKYTIEITNTLGGIVKTINTTEKRVEIQKGDMSKGMYYYSIKQNNQTLGSGKLAVE
ncbi:MAG: HYR domain-containing protein [Bacteroidetes bacterium]|nr:HYR domain-containing protein [Bacteroidota bacterium]NOG94139.1 HYR domain-containing protein [Bacteroidota bacterium]